MNCRNNSKCRRCLCQLLSQTAVVTQMIDHTPDDPIQGVACVVLGFKPWRRDVQRRRCLRPREVTGFELSRYCLHIVGSQIPK